MEQFIYDLIKSNNDAIKELNDLITSIYQDISNFKKTENSCFQKLIELSRAYCEFPFDPFTEVYYHTLKCPPFGSQFDVQIGSLGRQPAGWIQLTEQQKNDFEKELPDTESITNTLSKTIEMLAPLIQEAIDRNIIIKNLNNFDEQYTDLKKLDERWIYLPQEFIDKYKIKDVFTCDRSKISKYGYPYHSLLMASYDALYNNVRLIEGKINTSIRIFKRINYTLPFATVKGNGDDIVKSIQIGNLVQGNGNTLSDITSYVNSGQMNLNIENKYEVEKSLKEFLKNLDETDELEKYQKEDIVEETNKIISELSKPPESQERGRIEHRLRKIWGGVKDVVTVSASLASIATTLGISLII